MGITVLFVIWVISPLIILPIAISASVKAKDFKNKAIELEHFIGKLLLDNRITNDEVKKELTTPLNTINLYNNPYLQTPLTTQSNSEQASPNAPPAKQNKINDTAQLNTVPKFNTVEAEPLVQLKKNKISSISIVLIIGVIFIIISGAIFLTTTWHTISNILRTGVISLLSILFFGVSILAEKKLDLKKTGMAFYAIGTAFLPLTVVAIGIFKLLGQWLSLSGTGCPILISLAFFLSIIASLFGIYKYQSKVYAAVCLISLSGMVLSLFKFIAVSNIPTYILLMSIYGLLLVCISKPFSSYLNKINKYVPIAEIIETFSIINLIFITLFAYPVGFFKASQLSTITANALILIAYILLAIKETETFSYKKELSLSVVALAIQISRLICQTFNIEVNFHGYFITAIIIAISFFIFRFSKLFRTHITDTVFISILALCAIKLTFNADFLYVPPIYFSSIVSIIFILAIFSLAFEQQETPIKKIMRYALPFSFAVLTFGQILPIRKAFPYFSTNTITEIILLIYYLFLIITTVIMTTMEDRSTTSKELVKPFIICSALFGYVFQIIYWQSSMVPYLWILTALLAFKTIVAEKNQHIKLAKIYALTTMSTSLIATIAYNIIYSPLKIAGSLAVNISIIFIIYLILKKSKKDIYSLNVIRHFSIIALSIITFILSYLYIFTTNTSLVFIWCVCIIAISYFSGHFNSNNYLSVCPLIAFYLIFTASSISHSHEIIWRYSILFLLFAILGRFLYKNIKNTNHNKVYIDWFTITDFIPPIMICVFGKSIWNSFVGWIMMAIYSLLYFNRVDKINNKNKWILSITLGFLCIAFWNQPFINIPKSLNTEINMIPLVLLCIAIKFIWQEYSKATDNFNFTVATICLTLLGKDAFFSNTTLDVFVFLFIALGILIMSFMIKKKKWFLMSTICLLISTIYITRAFWLNIAWWIYLLAIGASLIILAGFNEHCKQKNSQALKEKYSKVMNRLNHDWQW